MKKILMASFFLLQSNYFAIAQTSARTFTYDAAGNRIAMGVPVFEIPRKTNDNVVKEMADTVSFTTHPNGHVLIHILSKSEDIVYSVRVYTTSGQIVTKVMTTTTPTFSIDLSSFQPGVYIVEVVINDRHITHKITKE